MQVISAVAEFERDLLLERTHSGIARAKAAGKRFGRPSALNEEQKLSVFGFAEQAVQHAFMQLNHLICQCGSGFFQHAHQDRMTPGC